MKEPIDLDNGYSQFALNIYFSKFKNCVIYIDNISKMNLSNNMHYSYLIKNIPLGWQKKIEFPKEIDNKHKELIEYICEYFKISPYDANLYMGFMDKKELKTIIDTYKIIEEK